MKDLESRLQLAEFPNELKESGAHVLSHLRQFEEMHIRDKSGYVILMYKPVAAQVGGISTGFTKLDSVMNSGGQSKLTEKEKAELASQI